MRITDGLAIGLRGDPEAVGRYATEGIPRSLGTLLPAVGSL